MSNKLAAVFLCAASGLLAAGKPSLVLEDFERPGSLKKWSGEISHITARSSHGNGAAQVRFSREKREVEFDRLAADWRGYDRLLFDIYSDGQGIRTATLRIYDEAAVKSGVRRDYFEADEQILLRGGWNHVELKLTGLHAASYQRQLERDHMRRLTLAPGHGALPWAVYLDNFRLVQGTETAATASRTQPQDMVTILDGRFFQIRQVAAEVPDGAEVAGLRKEAECEYERLAAAIRAAEVQGIETIYAERYLVTADLGLHVRPLLAWFNYDAAKREMFEYVARSCRQARLELEGKLTGWDRIPTQDDTQVGEPLVRPFPHLKGLPARDWFFRDERGEPLIILSLHSSSRLLQRFFATPMQHIESYSVGGGSRWSIEQSPVYAAFQEDPDTHRVGWDGWCGHLVRDLDSMGTSKPENTVICLESPRIRRAIEEYIRINIPKFHANPELLYNILAYELMYMCYCERSQQAFRGWLEARHGSIAETNGKWNTSFKSFRDVVAPPVKDAHPLPGTNRGLWYDWARFNQDRFTEHLLWVRNLVHKLDPTVKLAAGGSFSMLSGIAGTTGIDEERIVNEVDDVIIHEGGGSTMGMDLQLALADKKKPLADPEMNLGSVQALLPHILHGKSVVQIWHWPVQPSREFHGNVRTSLAHGWQYSLADVGELLRVALDVRRLNKEIAAFAEEPAQAAILYSQTSMLQLPPEMLTWDTTPYLHELRRTYEAGRFLDTRVTFVTERQVLKGRLEQFKILLVPGVKNLPAEVVQKIWDYAAQGGRVCFVAESLLGDEYNRPARYLDRLGIRVLAAQGPSAGLGGLQQGYYQSFSKEVEFAKTAALTLKPRPGELADLGELKARGLRQSVSASGDAVVLFEYPDGSPAILSSALGKGKVYYCAAALEGGDYGRLLDSLFRNAGVERPVRVHAPSGVEARFARLGNRRLMYVVNPGDKAVRLRIEAKFARLTDLRDGVTSDGPFATVPTRQTALYELLD